MIETDPAKPQSPRMIEAGVLTTRKDQPLPERLLEIYRHFAAILKEFSPDAVAVEEIFSVGAFPKSSIMIGHVHGIVLLASAQNSVPIFTYYPIQVKRALLGYGRSSKSQTQRMVQRTLALKEVPKPDDVADALAVALCHANRVRT